MTIDFQQVREQIKELGENASLRAQQLSGLRERAERSLRDRSIDLERLRQKVDYVALQFDPNLRCARPARDPMGEFPPLDTRHSLPPLPAQATLLAVDGSQITPDRHADVYFGLINVGAIQMQHGSPQSPQTRTQSRLFYGSELFDLNDSTLALERDLNERTMLAKMAAQAPAAVITLTDGPIELWGAKAGESDEGFQKSLNDYLQVLQQLAELNVSMAGYVDKPAANLVVRLLEIHETPESQLPEIKNHYPLRGVRDIELYRRLLEPGERSAVFAMQSRSAKNYRGALALHFFYLNVGRPGHPWLARVEIPAWVARDARMLDDLHAILVHQCHILGNRHYPYLLHRAHEAAVVTLEEKAHVAEMIALELRNRGVEVGEVSQKQAAKDLGGRTAYERSGKSRR